MIETIKEHHLKCIWWICWTAWRVRKSYFYRGSILKKPPFSVRGYFWKQILQLPLCLPPEISFRLLKSKTSPHKENKNMHSKNSFLPHLFEFFTFLTRSTISKLQTRFVCSSVSYHPVIFDLVWIFLRCFTWKQNQLFWHDVSGDETILQIIPRSEPNWLE